MSEKRASIAERKADKLKRVVLGAQLKAAKRVSGLFKDPGEADYNPDAASTWNECSVATRAAIELTKGTMALERARAANGGQGGEARIFGVVVMPQQVSSRSEWEKLAADAGKKPAIEAQVVEAARHDTGCECAECECERKEGPEAA